MERSADVVVIGAGPAGYVCAIRLAQLGKKVTVVERGDIGGVCLNVGCIPSKALIHAGSIYEKISHAEEMGIHIKGASIDLAKLMDWKSSVVKKLTGGVASLLKANGCTVISGEAKFVDSKTLEVKIQTGIERISFNHCVIATGSRPSKFPGSAPGGKPIIEIDQKLIFDSTGILSLKEIPKSMLCIGGGYIGMELGTFYSKIGTKITVVEAAPNLLGGVDPALAQVVTKRLKKRGIEIMTQTQVKSIKPKAKPGKNVNESSGIEVILSAGGKETTHEFDVALVTIGRTPNFESLALEKAGLKADAKGFIAVDAQRRTAVPHIFAIGDVAGQPLLAHKGSKEGLVAAEAIAGKKVAYDVVAMPAVIFTDPEIATVGLTEAEAKAKGISSVKVGVFPFAANGRALSMGEPDGMVKMVADGSGKLLGVHIVGAEASNLIAEAALALEMGAQVEDLALTVHAHPTLPETLMEAAEATLGHAIHIFQAPRR